MSKSNLNKNSNCCKYLKSLSEKDMKPGLIILCKCKLTNINKMEKKYITIHRKINLSLTNERSGGDGWNMVKKLGKENWNKAVESNKRPVIARNIKTGEEIEYPSITECAKSIGSWNTIVQTCIVGKRNKSTKGFYIRYRSEEFIEPKNLFKFKRIDNITGDEVVFNSIDDLIDAGYDPSFIFAVCNGSKHRKTAYGFKWMKFK
jgi:hypothetical protein